MLPVCVLESSHFALIHSRIAVFSVTVFYDERIVIVAEQRPDASEEDSFQWMSRVLQVNPQLSKSPGMTIRLNIFRHSKVHHRFLPRPLTVSTRSACTASPSCQPTRSQRRHSEASTSVKPSRTSWKEICTPAISSCALTPV